MVIHNDMQPLTLKVWDQDRGRVDELIGLAEPIDIRQFLEETSEIDIPLLTSNSAPGGGTLKITGRILRLSLQPVQMGPRVVGTSDMHLSAKFVSLTGISDQTSLPLKIRLSLAGVTAMSKGSKSGEGH